MDRTPKFNAEISKILEDLRPHTRMCSMCKDKFQIDEKDIEFFRKFKVPAPKNCGDCRRQIRLSFVNYTTLFKRDCNAPGHTEKMISSIPEGAKFPVYDFDYYWFSDRDRMENDMDFDLNNSIFSQFEKLFFKSPQPALTRDKTSINSEYVAYGSQLKNCYYNFGGLKSENVMYSIWPLNTKSSVDSLIITNSDLCYEGVYPENCYNCNFVYFSNDCIDSSFIYDCRNCNDCFGCINLRNRKYCIWNEQYTKDEYWVKVDEIKYKMFTDGEYGEFFPLSLSPFPYNASLSNIMYPISKDRVLELGGWWYDDKINIPDGIEIKNRNEIEKDIKGVKDDILNIGIISEGNGKPFRIVKDELDFYRRKNIAIPSLTPYERIIDRFKFVNNFKVFKDKCFKCGVEILSSYATSEGYKPYCDDCYKKEIY